MRFPIAITLLFLTFIAPALATKDVNYDYGRGGHYPGNPGHPGGGGPGNGGGAPRTIPYPKEYREQKAREAKVKADADAKAVKDKQVADAKIAADKVKADKIAADAAREAKRVADNEILFAQGRADAKARDDREAALLLGARQLSQTSKLEVTRVTDIASATLQAQRTQFEAPAYSYIESEIQKTRTLADSIVTYADQPGAFSGVQVLTQYAVDKANAINGFLAGVAGGAYNSAQRTLVKTADVVKAIYNDPTLLAHMGETLVKMVTSPYVQGVVEKEIKAFGVVLQSGTANEKGQALGELAMDTLTAITPFSELPAKLVLQDLAKGISEAGAKTLGTAIRDGAGAEASFTALVDEGKALAVKAEPSLRDWAGSNHKIRDVLPAETVNARFPSDYQPPFQAGTHVVDFTTREDSKWVRVHHSSNEVGPWVMRKTSLEGLSAEQIQGKYSLPVKPTHVSNVSVPGGTEMTRGMVQYHPGETMAPGESGAVQHRLGNKICGELPLPPCNTVYTHSRPLGEL